MFTQRSYVIVYYCIVCDSALIHNYLNIAIKTRPTVVGEQNIWGGGGGVGQCNSMPSSDSREKLTVHFAMHFVHECYTN